ncbi:hypothetical protein LCGC14_1201750 [marine sediment metagenome]|uniref:Phage portal protein n=1 Tax=marine sediment metagenome TaxID=412755 RepID=A0A0F9LGN9_9ZZZZ
MPDYRKLFDAKEKLNADLTRRMDNDVHLRDLLRYILRDELMRPLSGIIHVTLNKPAVFYANAFSALNNAHEQIIVESEVEGFDTHYIEDFRRAGFNAANARLRKQGRFKIEPFIDEQSCMRGRGSGLVVFQMNKGVLVADIRMWDSRFVSNEMDEDGLAWAGINGQRPMDLIKSQYPKEVAHFKIDTGKPHAKVLDVWHREGNEVWINDNKIVEQPHLFKFTPVVIETVTLGSMLSDEDSLMRRGESIYFLIRDIIPQLNRLASIVATQTQVRVKPPIMTPSSSKTDDPPTYSDVMDMGSSSSSGTEGITQILDTGDVNRAAGILFTLIETALQEGSLSSSDLGVPGSPPQSGVSLLIRKEGRAQIFFPRLEMKANLKLGIGDMFTEQVKQIGGSVELDNRTFEVGKLEGQYQVRHEYTVQSKAEDAGLASLVAAYGDLVSKKDKREIIGREDPKGDDDQLRWEEAELLSPLVKLRRTVESLENLGADEDAKLMTDEAGVQLEKLLSGEVEEREPVEPQNPKQVTSLFGGQSSGEQPPVEEV